MSAPNEMPYVVTYTVDGRGWQIPCQSLARAIEVRAERIAFYGGTVAIVDVRTGIPV